MLTITTCLTYPEPPSNLLPLADALTRDNIPTAFRALAKPPEIRLHPAFVCMGLCGGA